MQTPRQDLIRSLNLPSFQKKVNQSEDVVLDDIIYLRASANYTIFFLRNGKKIITSCSLNRYKKLETFNFVRIHKSFVINISHIEIFDFKNCFLTMTNGENIDISRRRMAKLRKAFVN